MTSNQMKSPMDIAHHLLDVDSPHGRVQIRGDISVERARELIIQGINQDRDQKRPNLETYADTILVQCTPDGWTTERVRMAILAALHFAQGQGERFGQ